MLAQQQVRAVAGAGLEGDRYRQRQGTFWREGKAGLQVTLIEMEALEALQREYGIALSAAESRRNLATRGVALNHLVGRCFRVGEVLLQGVRLCEPCGHLEQLARAGIKRGLVHRGGLRADVVEGGLLRVGDAVTPL
ncbi:MAG: MOSC domain-containing protein [Planctomycetota bacterium]|nr:MAG: MOSC domain-containing protein [Planctomycetota bacterium]